MKRTCENCTKRLKGGDKVKGCQVLVERQKNCWAWTDDPEWLRKVNEAVEKYSGYRFNK